MDYYSLQKNEGVYKIENEVAISFGLGFSFNLKEWGNMATWETMVGVVLVELILQYHKKNSIVIIMTQKEPFSDEIVRELTPIIFNNL